MMKMRRIGLIALGLVLCLLIEAAPAVALEWGAWGSWRDNREATSSTKQEESRYVYPYYYFQCRNCGAHMHVYTSCYSWAGGCGSSTWISSNDFVELWETTSYDAAGMRDWHGTGRVYTYLDGSLVFKRTDRSPKYQYRYRIGTENDVAVTSVKLNKSSASVYVNNQLQLAPTLAPADATNKKLTWSSADALIAKVDQNGLVTGTGKGKTTITATAASGASASCKVSVSFRNVTRVSLSSRASVYSGGTKQLAATVSPSNASDKTVTWSSNKSSIASVSERGLVTCHATGKATITAKSHNGKKAYCTITVKPIVVKSVTLQQVNVELALGTTYAIQADVVPADATNRSLRYSSSNSGIASVSSEGVVTAKKMGKAIVTVKSSNNKQAKCTISVVENITIPVASVNMNSVSMNLRVGDAHQLSATVKPDNATNKGLTWTSSNASIATVSASGLVSAKAAGSATITAMADNGVKAICTVTVTQVITINISGATQPTGTLAIGQVFVLEGMVTANVALTSVTAGVYVQSSGAATTQVKTVYPNATTCNLKTSVDAAIEFNKLAAGAYMYKVSATANGITRELISSNFSVVQGSNQGSNQGSSKQKAFFDAMDSLTTGPTGFSDVIARYCIEVGQVIGTSAASTDAKAREMLFTKDAWITNMGQSIFTQGPIYTVSSYYSPERKMTYIHIAFLGTRGNFWDGGWSDWLRNITALSYGDTHSGFTASANQFRAREKSINVSAAGNKTLESFLKGVTPSNDKVRILVSGHSMGGSVALIYAAKLLDAGIPDRCIKVYTYGAPQAFSTNKVSSLNSIGRFKYSHYMIANGDPTPTVGYLTLVGAYSGGWPGNRRDLKPTESSIKDSTYPTVPVDTRAHDPKAYLSALKAYP